MERHESHQKIQEVESSPSTVFGRELIPTDAATEAQIALMRTMAGESVWDVLSESERDEHAMDWMERYVLGDFNAFAEYCNAHASDSDFMNRAIQKSLNEDDFSSMQAFIEESPKGGKFIIKH